MNLLQALDLRPGSLIALVGAGGKTTAAWTLLRSFVSAGERVVFTTTTHIFEPQRAPLLLSPYPELGEIVRAMTESPGLVLAAKRGEPGNPAQAAHSPYPAHPTKLVGLEPDLLAELARRLPGITWIVEADGSRGRLLKAPGPHEPVIPPNAEHVIAVASLTALGHPLNDRVVHRAQTAAALLRVPISTPITPSLLAGLVGHPSGGLKGIPPRAATIVLLTQQTSSPHPQAAAIAHQLLTNRRVTKVVLANLLDPSSPILGVWK